jgi:hypothetical protein
MNAIRWSLGVAGALLALFGVFRLLTEIPFGNLAALALWLVAALLLHDGVLAPLTAGVGVVVGRVVPPRLRRYVQGGLVVGAIVTVIAVPLIIRRGSQPPEKALLQQNYAANLGVLIGIVAGATVVLYMGRVLRDHRASATNVRPAERHTSSNP